MEINSSNVDSLLGTSFMVTENVGETGEVNSSRTATDNFIKSKNEKSKKANSGNQSTRANEAKSSR